MAGHAEQMHLVRRDLCRRAVEHARDGTTDMAPDVMHNDVAAYIDPERYAREFQTLFREMPQVVCLSSDLPEPGSFRLFDDAARLVKDASVADLVFAGMVRRMLAVDPDRRRLLHG